MPRRSPIVRLMRYVPDSRPDVCWEWSGGRDKDGYGKFYLDGKTWAAHRASYELLVGPIPTGLVIDHLCRTPCCVNPAHLEPVTIRVNILRGVGNSAKNAAKAFCQDGHEFTAENTYYWRNQRVCRICAKVRNAAAYLRRKAA